MKESESGDTILKLESGDTNLLFLPNRQGVFRFSVCGFIPDFIGIVSPNLLILNHNPYEADKHEVIQVCFQKITREKIKDSTPAPSRIDSNIVSIFLAFVLDL